MAKIPGVDSVVTGVLSVLQAQTEALAALPGAVHALSVAVRNLAEVTAGAKDTAVILHRLAVRVDGIVAELEEPLKALGPGLTKAAKVLDDPTIDTIPDSLAALQRDVLPVIRTLADTHEKVSMIAGSTERLMSFVDETGRTLAGLPGAALLGRRQGKPRTD